MMIFIDSNYDAIEFRDNDAYDDDDNGNGDDHNLNYNNSNNICMIPDFSILIVFI